jgi:predicted nucleic acid-binding protein
LNSNLSKKIIPQVIYLDTNIFWQLNDETVNVDFLELKRLSKIIRVKIFISEIVFRERLHQIARKVSNEIERIKTANQNIVRMLRCEPLIHEHPTDLEKRIEEVLSEFLRKTEIEVVPIPRTNILETIIEMSIRRIAPFEEGEKREKGFKDAIILLNIIEHMKTNKFSDAFFISSDKIFQSKDIEKLFERKEVNISILENITGANNILGEQICAIEKSEIEKKKKKIKSFLDSYFIDISKYILENTKITKSFIRGRGLLKILSKEDFDNITRILSINPREISSVSFGHIYSEQPQKQEVEPVTFSVSIDFDILVTKLLLPDEQSITLASIEDFDDLRDEFPGSEEYRKTVTRSVDVEAELYKENDQYANLNLLRVIAY